MINYASKYEKELAQEFTLKSVVDGAVGKDYEFTFSSNLHSHLLSKAHFPVTL